MRFALLAGQAVLLLWPVVSRGHDALEITAEARLFADRLELNVTMSASTARQACRREGGLPPRLAKGADDPAEELFEKRAAELFTVSSGGAVLAYTKARAAFTAENDLRFWVDYPLPALGPLKIEAWCLKRLPPDGYGVALIVMEQAKPPGRVLGQGLLTLEEPALVVEPSPGAPSSAAPPAPVASPGKPRWVLAAGLILALAVAALLAGLRRR